MLTPSQELFRIHQAIYGPWWFSSRSSLRFDLAFPRGTCYLAEEDLGAFVEAFQDWTGTVIPRTEIDARRIASLRVPTPFRLADCTDPRVLRFGVTAEIHSSPERALTQAWAKALDLAGFNGVRFLVRHDPAQHRGGIALFGSAGEAPWHVDGIAAVPADLIDRARTRFGIEVG